MATTIPAGTLRLLLTSISYRAKARKRYGESRQWFRAARCAPAARLPRRACMVCDLLHCLAWIHSRAHRCPLIYLIIIGGLRWSVQRPGVAVVSGIGGARSGACMPSSVVQVILYSLVLVWYRGRLNGHNRRKRLCKALCAVLCRWRYNCIDRAKHTVNACIGLYCIRAKRKPCTGSGCKAKEKPRQRGRGGMLLYLLALNSAEKNQKKNRMQEKITCRTPSRPPTPRFTGFKVRYSITPFRAAIFCAVSADIALSVCKSIFISVFFCRAIR